MIIFLNWEDILCLPLRSFPVFEMPLTGNFRCVSYLKHQQSKVLENISLPCGVSQFYLRLLRLTGQSHCRYHFLNSDYGSLTNWKDPALRIIFLLRCISKDSFNEATWNRACKTLYGVMSAYAPCFQKLMANRYFRFPGILFS